MADDRTLGETRDCRGCRYWSEMMARVDLYGQIRAMCLSETGSKSGGWTRGRTTCEAWASGHYGAVDDPPDYGKTTRKLYAEDLARKEDPDD